MYPLNSKHIAIEGAIGAGKTSLVLQLTERYHARSILEIVEENPFLSRFYEDIKNYAFQTQIFFLLSRYEQQTKEARQNLPQQLSFSDYMFAKDKIFAHLNLSGNELKMYDHLYKIVCKDISVPDLIVYLRTTTDMLMKRIKLRARPFERKISFKYMDKLNNAYENFFKNIKNNYNKTKLLVIETDNLDFIINKKDLDTICEKIYQKDHEKEQ